MRQLKRILLLALTGALLAVAGCGGEEEGAPIPADTAAALQEELDGVQARIDNGSAGACRDVLEGARGPNLERVQQLLDGLPDDVDPDVRAALEDSFDRLWELVRQDCDEKEAEEEAAEPEPAPAPVPEETVPEETVPEETTPDEDEEEGEEQPPPDPGNEQLPPEGDGNNEGLIPGEGNGGGVGPG